MRYLKKFNTFINEGAFGTYGGDPTQNQNFVKPTIFNREKNFGKFTSEPSQFNPKDEIKFGTYLDQEGHEELTNVPGTLNYPKNIDKWTQQGEKLYKKFKFESFKAASTFMKKVFEISEKINHHPEIKNIYDTVEIWLSTHDDGCKVTEKDYHLASKIDEIFK